jgi:hypothetical protein
VLTRHAAPAQAGSPGARRRHHSGDTTTGETAGVASAIQLGSESSGSEGVAAHGLPGRRGSSRELL